METSQLLSLYIYKKFNRLKLCKELKVTILPHSEKKIVSNSNNYCTAKHFNENKI